SFGSLFASIAAGHEPRFMACAVISRCLEPGGHTVLEDAPPTFKQRGRYMAGVADRPTVGACCRTLTWEGHAESMRGRYPCLARALLRRGERADQEHPAVAARTARSAVKSRLLPSTIWLPDSAEGRVVPAPCGEGWSPARKIRIERPGHFIECLAPNPVRRGK